MRNKKGFTLVELLAIIVILAVIMVIAVPKILDVVNGSKSSAWKDNVGMIKKAIVTNSQLFDPETGVQKYSIGNLCTNTSKLSEIVKLEDTTVSCSGNKFTLTGTGQFAGKSATITCTNNKCTVAINEAVLAAGLYDGNDNLIASWEDLVNVYGMQVDWASPFRECGNEVCQEDQGRYYVPFDNYDIAFYNNPIYGDRYNSMATAITEPGWYKNEDGVYTKVDLKNENIESHAPFYIFEHNQKLRNGKKLVIPKSGMPVEKTSYDGDTEVDEIYIPYLAFANCINLESVIIEEGINNLGESTFSRCINLKNIVIPSTVGMYRAIYSFGPFFACHALETVNIPGEYGAIEECMFAQCFNLKEVNLSEGIEYIHERAFEDDINLVKVTIPSTVHEIWAPFSMSANPAGKEDCLNNNCYHPKQIVFNNPNGWYINEYDDPNCTKNCSMHKAYFSVEDMSNPTRAAEIVGEHYWIWQDAN